MLYQEGINIAQIGRITGYNRKIVYRALGGLNGTLGTDTAEPSPMSRSRTVPNVPRTVPNVPMALLSLRREHFGRYGRLQNTNHYKSVSSHLKSGLSKPCQV